MTPRNARRMYWIDCALIIFNGLMMLWWISRGSLMSLVNGAALPFLVFSALVCARYAARPVPVLPSRHDACLAEIARLERELASDGVPFVMSDAEFDREVDRVTSEHAERMIRAASDEERERVAEYWRKQLPSNPSIPPPPEPCRNWQFHPDNPHRMYDPREGWPGGKFWRRL